MKYKTNFITNVILRLDFNSIADFNDGLLEDFHKEIRDKFSKSEPTELNQFTIKEDGSIETDFKKEPLGIFISENNTAKVSFAPNFILITMSNYESFEPYVRFVNDVINAFNKISKVEFLNRVGLRYVNQINIHKSDPLNWNLYINSSLFAPVNKFFENKQDIARSIGQTIFNYDSYLMNFTYGVLNPDYPARIVKNEFILDYDCYAINIINEKLFEDHINQFHVSIADLFEKSITKKLREKMGS